MPAASVLRSRNAYDPGDLLSLQVNLTGWQHHKSSYAAVIDDDVAMAPLTAVVKVAWCRAKADTRELRNRRHV